MEERITPAGYDLDRVPAGRDFCIRDVLSKLRRVASSEDVPEDSRRAAREHLADLENLLGYTEARRVRREALTDLIWLAALCLFIALGLAHI